MLDGLLNMGGYARFVWPSFGLYVLALVVLAWQARRAHRRTLNEIRMDRESENR